LAQNKPEAIQAATSTALTCKRPSVADRWNFLPDCGGNAEFAHKVASMILDSEQSRCSTADPFWKEAEKAALTAILLQLNQLHPHPAPHMIQELISTLSLQQLNDLMMKSLDPKVPLYWGMFSKVEPKLQAGVLIGLGVACADFSTPNMMAIASPITNPMAARGVRFVNFSDLRQANTAIFMVVPEGDAERYKRVLSTFFGLANDCLRNGAISEDSAPILFNLDEIGNIHIPDLPAALGVGRGRRMTYALGYQNIAQLYHQYGADGGDAVLGSVGAMVFLPGVDQRTAEYASKRLGTTTVLQASSVDVHDGNKLDQERSTEVGRALMDASEIRQMTKYKQAVAIISNAPPVRLTFPKFAKADHPPLSERERRFQIGRNPNTSQRESLPESGQTNDYQKTLSRNTTRTRWMKTVSRCSILAGATCEADRMRKTKTRASFNKLKITWLLLALAGILAVGSYGWHIYSLLRRLAGVRYQCLKAIFRPRLNYAAVLIASPAPATPHPSDSFLAPAA
jgi:type IV secretory pathway TraG/TraD family ATPase VirD4